MKHDMRRVTGERLRAVREKLALAQKDFAKMAGVTRQTISLYEKGERLPDAQTLHDICRVTGCSAQYLLGFQQEMYGAENEQPLRGGLTVKCYLPADGCEHIRDGDWCSRFGCYCADVHIDEEKEDE